VLQLERGLTLGSSVSIFEGCRHRRRLSLVWPILEQVIHCLALYRIFRFIFYKTLLESPFLLLRFFIIQYGKASLVHFDFQCFDIGELLCHSPRPRTCLVFRALVRLDDKLGVGVTPSDIAFSCPTSKLRRYLEHFYAL